VPVGGTREWPFSAPAWSSDEAGVGAVEIVVDSDGATRAERQLPAPCICKREQSEEDISNKAKVHNSFWHDETPELQHLLLHGPFRVCTLYTATTLLTRTFFIKKIVRSNSLSFKLLGSLSFVPIGYRSGEQAILK